MSRISVSLPSAFNFTTEIPVRITDLNYGSHVGNDSILALIHEARVRFLSHHGFTEMDIMGIGLIMSDVAIEFKNELFYGEALIVSVAANDFSRVTFDIVYKLEKESENGRVLVAKAKTGMVCYNYEAHKKCPVPEEALLKLSS